MYLYFIWPIDVVWWNNFCFRACRCSQTQLFWFVVEVFIVQVQSLFQMFDAYKSSLNFMKYLDDKKCVNNVKNKLSLNTFFEFRRRWDSMEGGNSEAYGRWAERSSTRSPRDPSTRTSRAAATVQSTTAAECSQQTWETQLTSPVWTQRQKPCISEGKKVASSSG